MIRAQAPTASALRRHAGAALLASALLLAASGCGGDDGAPPGTGCQRDDRTYEISADEVDHACGHLDAGPYGELAAGDELTNLHMLYTVTLADQGGGSFAGEIRFTARDSATHVFYHLADVPAAYLDEAGEDLCVAATLTPAGCDGIRRVDLIDLEDRQPLRISLGPSPEPTVRLVAERK